MQPDDGWTQAGAPTKKGAASHRRVVGCARTAADDADWLSRLSPQLASADMPHPSWFDRRPSVPSEPMRKDHHNADDAESPPSTPHDLSQSLPLPSQCSSTLPSRHRTSILAAASDALGLRKKLGSVSRKKPNFPSLSHAPHHAIPDVIEISASNNTTVTASVGGAVAHRDFEREERERLRDAAAQSIGLGPGLLHDPYRSESQLSLDSLQTPSQPAHLPSFPATLAALDPFTLLCTTLPKFTPPSSLLVYALARQWKSRTIVLTSHSLPRKTHVHLFKGSAKDEKEIERLQVTEDSVIFVAEEDVGGRGNVVNFAGKEVSARRSVATAEENARTMWFLQITDPAESQRWIAAIKSAVLTQRAVRAGLGIPARTSGRNEPKGDMDVMLSMHLQGIIAMHPSPPSPPVPTSPSPPASLRSLRINTSSSSSPTTAMKGIFSGTRPRSPSIEGSTTLSCPSGHTEDSFGAAGTNLLTMLRTKSSADSSSSPSHSLPLPLPHVPGKGSPAPSLRSAFAPVVITASDLKISKDRDAPDLSASVPIIRPSGTAPSSNTPPMPALAPQGALALSLQPPPRKCKYAATPPPAAPHQQQAMYKQSSGNRSVAGNFGIPFKGFGDVTLGETSPVPPDSSPFSDGHSESFLPNLVGAPSSFVDEEYGGEENDEVAPTLLVNGSVHSSSPADVLLPKDRLLQSTAISKRWSRQPLPKQLTPPSGPPPAIPPSPENNPRTSVESSVSIPVAYTAADRSPSSSSTNSRSRPRISPRSGSSLSPTFWKRASNCSTYSASSTGTSESRDRSLIPLSSGGESFPSSLRSVISIGGPSRPLSFSVPGSSPVSHVVTTKRRSMPPPRPAPNFAPPPAPAIEESPRPGSTPTPQKSFRSSVAQRALRLSLTSPKPPPSTALPPRPDEPVVARGHRRSSSAGIPDVQSIPRPSSRPASAQSGVFISSHSPAPLLPSRNLSLRQRLRILSTPSASHSPPTQSLTSVTPARHVSTLDLSDDNDDDFPTPLFHSPQPFGLGEPILTMQHDPSFLQLSTPVSPTMPKPPPRNPLRSMPTPAPLPSSSMSPRATDGSDELGTLPLAHACDFVALSPPPPPRKASKFVATRTERTDAEDGPEGAPREESGKLVTLSERGSVVSLGFVTA